MPEAPRHYKSAYSWTPVVYAQKEGRWWRYVPGGEAEELTGTIPESIQSEVYEISEAEAGELLGLRRAEAAEPKAAEAGAAEAEAGRGRELHLSWTGRDRLLGIAASIAALEHLLVAAAVVSRLSRGQAPGTTPAASSWCSRNWVWPWRLGRRPTRF